MASTARSLTNPLLLRRLSRRTTISSSSSLIPSSTTLIRHHPTRHFTSSSTLSTSSPLLSTPPKRPTPFPTITRKHHQQQHRTLFIQTEPTPNPDALKFIPGLPVLPANASSIEYTSGRQSTNSPLARSLFQLDGVTSVFYGPDFITVTKAPDSLWHLLKPEVFALITEYLNNGQPVVQGELLENEDTKAQEGDSEVVSMIKELLDTRIRPAIQEDGGDIEYRGFTDAGQVLLKLRGACRTCDSSTVTLKTGIESMLMHYIEEVKGVTQVLDQEEEIAQREFERFEANLAKLKGNDAVPKTSGPHGIDAAP
ncbi:hypothetical protein TWF102_000560 [Orbilia oligospora]|uniref:Scaffold protein Nfu/NifU N-terminal domain-containing protein n=1 Tax=Orbilia oligospora TaxID=2813651 RepID=A0A7C8JNP5_ORBOL|nr:hypothetical protein TWF102_000560 [Orbilia oligospora]KAF3117448.1 hypothetical protein TWF103_006191 [Orbilia oligospora]KAF3133880.1 hypothetical protein TWF703_006594 [Orbilia oligospora]KAF3146963.1 hypothetical protein TWF594_003015 [Orbilia oligospora]